MQSLKLIGKGHFSKVYANELVDYVLIESDDYAKECMYLFFPEHENLPIRLGYEKFKNKELYKMKKYNKTRKILNVLDDDQYLFYKELKNIETEYNKMDNRLNIRNLYKIVGNSKLLENQKELIIELLDCLANYGEDLCFEISPRNIAIDKGKLILLDCFFFKSQF